MGDRFLFKLFTVFTGVNYILSFKYVMTCTLNSLLVFLKIECICVNIVFVLN